MLRAHKAFFPESLDEYCTLYLNSIGAGNIPMAGLESELLVRAYNTGAGDCFLVRVRDLESRSRFQMLADFGSCKCKSSNIRKIGINLRKMGPIDLLVLSHTHTDHVSGLCPWLRGLLTRSNPLRKAPKCTWVPIQCHPDFGIYYDIKSDNYHSLLEIIKKLESDANLTADDRKCIKELMNAKKRRAKPKQTTPCMNEFWENHRGETEGVFALCESDTIQEIQRKYDVKITVLAPLPPEAYVKHALLSMFPMTVFQAAGVNSKLIHNMELSASALGIHYWSEPFIEGPDYFREKYGNTIGLIRNFADLYEDYTVLKHIEELRRHMREPPTELIEDQAMLIWRWIRENQEGLLKYLSSVIAYFTPNMAHFPSMFLHAAYSIIRVENGGSVVLQLEFNDKVLMFTGDMKQSEWNAICHLHHKCNDSILKPLKFFKVPHHGSALDALPINSYLGTILPLIEPPGEQAWAAVPSCYDPSGRGKSCRQKLKHDVGYLTGRAEVFWTSQTDIADIHVDWRWLSGTMA